MNFVFFFMVDKLVERSLFCYVVFLIWINHDIKLNSQTVTSYFYLTLYNIYTSFIIYLSIVCLFRENNDKDRNGWTILD